MERGVEYVEQNYLAAESHSSLTVQLSGGEYVNKRERETASQSSWERPTVRDSAVPLGDCYPWSETDRFCCFLSDFIVRKSENGLSKVIRGTMRPHVTDQG